MQYPRVKLGDICEINLGKTPPRGVKKFWDIDHTGDMVWVSISDMNNLQDGKIFDSKEYISSQAISECGIPFVEPETLLLSFKLTLGRTAIAGRRLCTNEAIAALPVRDAYKSKIDILYLKTYFDFFDWDAYASADEKILGKTLNKKKLDVVPIILPPLSIQKEIVSRLEKELGKVDEMADAFKRMAELADEEFKAVLSETFEHVDGKSVKLGDICSKLSTGPFGSVLHKNDYVENGIPLVNPMHIIGDSIVPSHDMTVSVETAKRLDAYKLSRGDIVIGRRGEMGRAAVVTSKEEGWLCGTGSFFLHLKQQIEPDFFLLCFKSPKFINQMVNTAKGATMQNLNHGLLKSLELILPSKETQLEIVKNIALAKERCEKLISYSQQSLSLCTELRKSILQEAFE